MNQKERTIVTLAIITFLQTGIIGYMSFYTTDCTKFEKPDQSIIDSAIQSTELQTGSRYELIPVYIDTGKHIGFLSSVNDSKYMYLGIGEYVSIFQEDK